MPVEVEAAQINAVIVDVLRNYYPWNFSVVTAYAAGQSMFDDELARGTTYQVKAVSISDPLTSYTTSSYTNIRGAVADMEAWLATRGTAKFATVNGQLKVLATAHVFTLDLPE